MRRLSEDYAKSLELLDLSLYDRIRLEFQHWLLTRLLR